MIGHGTNLGWSCAGYDSWLTEPDAEYLRESDDEPEDFDERRDAE